MEQTLSVLVDNSRSILRDFAAQLPLVGVAIVVFGVFVLLARLLRRAVRRALGRQDPAFRDMLAQLAHVGAIVLGIFVALWIAIPTVRFGQIFASFGVTGVVLGFALRDIIENFVAGILILWRRPFTVGDQVRSGTFEGTVGEINFRSTVIRSYDGVKVFIPNGKIFTEPLENFTGFSSRRTRIVLGIDQTASIETARRVILDSLRTTAGVLADPPPAVLFAEVGDFTNLLHVLYWTAPPTRFSELETSSLVTEQLYRALQDAGIGFPYPIQTIELAAPANATTANPQTTSDDRESKPGRG